MHAEPENGGARRLWPEKHATFRRTLEPDETAVRPVKQGLRHCTSGVLEYRAGQRSETTKQERYSSEEGRNRKDGQPVGVMGADLEREPPLRPTSDSPLPDWEAVLRTAPHGTKEPAEMIGTFPFLD